MNSFQMRGVVAAISGAMLLGMAPVALADSTSDIVNALMAKGVLTEEEGALLLKGHAMETETQAKTIKKAGKVTISDVIDNATIYGDLRVREELRTGDGTTTVAGRDDEERRERKRYKLVLGVKTEAADFYTDLALAMGSGGRSDNATFGKTTFNDKETVFVKTAMLGWKATDWLTLEAGRMKNPLYTTPMVWDGDLAFEGLAEKFKFKAGDADIFVTAAQAQYRGDRKTIDNGGSDTTTNELLAFQGGLRYPFGDTTSAKVAVTYTTFTNDDEKQNGTANRFSPGISRDAGSSGVGTNVDSVNDIRTIEIPMEFNWMVASNIGLRVFGDYVKNLDGNDRADAACVVDADVCGKGDDSNAWLLGIGLASAADLKAFEGDKMKKGDWAAKLWYQSVGAYSVDPNAVDSDFMDSKVNMKGIVFKGQYNLRDNVMVNFAAGHATRKNGDLGTGGVAGDLGMNLDKYDLYQLDLTYKF
jgi:hypothetical protein